MKCEETGLVYFMLVFSNNHSLKSAVIQLQLGFNRALNHFLSHKQPTSGIQSLLFRPLHTVESVL